MKQETAEGYIVKMYVYDKAFRGAIEKIRAIFDIPKDGFNSKKTHNQWLQKRATTNTSAKPHFMFQKAISKLTKRFNVAHELNEAFAYFIAFPHLPLPKQESVYINESSLKDGIIEIHVTPYASKKELDYFFINQRKKIREAQKSLKRGVGLKRIFDYSTILTIDNLRRRGYKWYEIELKLSRRYKKDVFFGHLQKLYYRNKPK